MRMNAKTGALLQRVLWHIRWALLLFIIVFSVIAWMVSVDILPFLCVQGITWAVYFFLGQWEDYFECRANCSL